tara:strand:+ start:24045 stop:24260 length:216 start_codon:yes stop_codon:yes gene_type:complete
MYWASIYANFPIMVVLPHMEENIIGYCVKCKEKREMKDVEKTEIKPGRPAAKGTCTTCGTGMYKILPKSEA